MMMKKNPYSLNRNRALGTRARMHDNNTLRKKKKINAVARFARKTWRVAEDFFYLELHQLYTTSSLYLVLYNARFVYICAYMPAHDSHSSTHTRAVHIKCVRSFRVLAESFGVCVRFFSSQDRWPDKMVIFFPFCKCQRARAWKWSTIPRSCMGNFNKIFFLHNNKYFKEIRAHIR